MSSAVPVSRISPAYITATWSAIRATTPRSCVIRMMAMSLSRCRSRMRSRICAWMVTSRAVVGSSAIRMAGLQARAMAIMERCSMPPENSKGYWRARFSGSLMRVIASSSTARARAWRWLWPRCTCRVSAIWSPIVMVGFSDVIGSWKIMPIWSPRRSRPSTITAPRMSRPRKCAVPPTMRPGGIGMRPITLCTVTDLPQPDSPTIASVLPACTSNETPRTACTVPP